MNNNDENSHSNNNEDQTDDQNSSLDSNDVHRNTKLSKKSGKNKKDVYLTPSQLLALDYMKRESNVFITGSAGTGKSHLIKYYKQNHNKKIPLLSSTGVSAVIFGGRTVHSFFSLGAMNEDYYYIMERIYTNPKLLARLQTVKEVVIDEVSMLSGKTFDMIDRILKEIKNNNFPFGGVRLICVGDFFQIPPIDVNEKNSLIMLL